MADYTWTIKMPLALAIEERDAICAEWDYDMNKKDGETKEEFSKRMIKLVMFVRPLRDYRNAAVIAANQTNIDAANAQTDLDSENIDVT